MPPRGRRPRLSGGDSELQALIRQMPNAKDEKHDARHDDKHGSLRQTALENCAGENSAGLSARVAVRKRWSFENRGRSAYADDAFATRKAASGMCTAVAIEQFIADIEIVSVTASASITCHRSPD